MQIELLYIQDCPGRETSRADLDRVLQSRGLDARDVSETMVDLDSVDRLRFVGSPTIRINGRDVEPGYMDGGDYGLRCRTYPGARSDSHAPSVQWVEAAIDAALREGDPMSSLSADERPIIRLRNDDPLHGFILETFAATGRSPSLDAIRSRFGLQTNGEAEGRLQDLERTGAIHRDRADTATIHAYPFSDAPTLHRVHLKDGLEVFAMCAIDALGMPFMLRRDADIESVCAECDAVIAVNIRWPEVSDYSPHETVVWLASRTEGCVAATDLCPALNFFCSAEHLNAWTQRTDATGRLLAMDEALSHGRQIFEELLYNN